MRRWREGTARILQTIFGYGIMVTLLLGGLSFFGYIVAIALGGDVAENICMFVYKQLYPVLVLLTTSIIVLGLCKMYLCGEAEYTKNKSKHTTNM